MSVKDNGANHQVGLACPTERRIRARIAGEQFFEIERLDEDNRQRLCRAP